MIEAPRPVDRGPGSGRGLRNETPPPSSPRRRGSHAITPHRRLEQLREIPACAGMTTPAETVDAARHRTLRSTHRIGDDALALEFPKDDALPEVLRTQSLDFAQVIASRAALRTLIFSLEGLSLKRAFHRATLLSIFRASAACWAAFKKPTNHQAVQDAIAAAFSSGFALGHGPSVVAANTLAVTGKAMTPPVDRCDRCCARGSVGEAIGEGKQDIGILFGVDDEHRQGWESLESVGVADE